MPELLNISFADKKISIATEIGMKYMWFGTILLQDTKHVLFSRGILLVPRWLSSRPVNWKELMEMYVGFAFALHAHSTSDDMPTMHYYSHYLQVSRNLKMAIRAIRALNTTAGLSNYTVAVIGTPQEVCTITKAYEECGLHRHELAFIHKEASKQGK